MTPDPSLVLPDLTAPASNQHDFAVTDRQPIIWIARLVSCAFLPVSYGIVTGPINSPASSLSSTGNAKVQTAPQLHGSVCV